MMEKTDKQQRKILEVLLKNDKLGIRQLLTNLDVVHMGQRGLYKNLEVLKQKNLVAVSSDGYRKFHYLTPEGLRIAKRVVTFKTIERETRNLLNSSDANKKLCAFEMIFTELFKVFCGEKWDLEEAKKWKKFCDIVELTAKEYLNRDLSKKNIIQRNRYAEYHDPYFALRTIDGYSLLEDALLAKKLDHHLTENHIDILLRTKAVDSRNELEKCNAEWFRRNGIEKRRKKFFEEEKERDNLLSERRIAPMNRTRKIRWARDSMHRVGTIGEVLGKTK